MAIIFKKLTHEEQNISMIFLNYAKEYIQMTKFHKKNLINSLDFLLNYATSEILIPNN